MVYYIKKLNECVYGYMFKRITYGQREGDLGQKRDDGGDCAIIRKRQEEWRALVHMQMIEFHVAIFAWPCVFGPPSSALVDYHLERAGMLLHDAIGENCEKDATAKNQAAGAQYMG